MVAIEIDDRSSKPVWNIGLQRKSLSPGEVLGVPDADICSKIRKCRLPFYQIILEPFKRMV